MHIEHYFTVENYFVDRRKVKLREYSEIIVAFFSLQLVGEKGNAGAANNY